MSICNSVSGNSLINIIEFIYGVKCLSNLGEGHAIAVTFLLGSIIGTLSYMIKIRSDRAAFRRANTEKYFEETDTNIETALRNIGHIAFVDGKKLSNEELHKDENKHLDDWNAVFKYVENMGVAVRHGHISERYILSMRRVLIHNVYHSIQDIIYENRGRPDYDNFLINFEILYYRSLLEQWRLISPMAWVEWIFAKPFFTWSQKKYQIEFYIFSSFYKKNINVLIGNPQELKRIRTKFYRQLVIPSVVIVSVFSVLLYLMLNKVFL